LMLQECEGEREPPASEGRTHMTTVVDSSADDLYQAALGHWKSGAAAEAEALCRRALQRCPTHAGVLCLLGQIASRGGNLGLAAALLSRAVALAPEEPAYHLRLGIIYLRLNQLPHAVAHFGRALELDPGYRRAYANLGAALLNEGRVPEAVAHFRRGLELHPDDADVHTNLLFSLHYLPGSTRAELFELAREWGKRHAPSGNAFEAHANLPDPERRLRIGYVSGNFAAHPVGYFIEPVLRAHRRDAFEVFCYTNRHTVDAVTRRLWGYADHWRNLTDLDDAEASRFIRRDGIDLLVDLSGHTSWHRLPVFARKPAPVQASWMGYFDTTGVPAVDYLIGDEFVCPPGDEPFYTERLVRLPGCYLCYAPQTDLEVGPLPLLTSGAPTFGCFNKLAKITPEVIRTWAALLRVLEGSRLVLKDSGLEHASVRERLLGEFASSGIASSRIELQGRSPHRDYLAAYGRIDIALDPFPYNGGTTTVEALWMGVPVVTLAGDRFVSRMGLAHLSTVGLSELVARSTREYVRTTLRLAGDQERLAQLRAGLRARVAASPLCDGPGFIDGLEVAYRRMWRSWCDKSNHAAG